MAKKKFEQYGMGAIEDKPSSKDFMMRKIMKATVIPDAFSLLDKATPIKHQGERGSCLAHATAKIKEYQEMKQRRLKFLDLSEEWIYRQIRVEGGGAYMRDGFKIVQQTGVPKEQYMPYDDTITDDSQEKPFGFDDRKMEIKAQRSAKAYKVASYARLTTVGEICESIFVNGPTMIGIGWLDGWFNPRTMVDGRFILLPNDGYNAGGHAIPLFGYNKTERYFEVPNSWGEDWASNGIAHIHFDSVHSGFMDAWSAVDITSSNIIKGVLKELIEEKNK